MTRARVGKFLVAMSETFWLVPGVMVAAGIFGAIGLVELDRSGLVPDWLIHSAWLYNGGGTGARTMLGAVASSVIGVAGTVFSITIAALSLAAGQMGPRLLRNFIHDRGNQFTLGAFLGTFCYTLMVLRSVRTENEGAFVPHLSMTVDLLLAFLSVGVLVFFVGHMAGRINVDTVIGLVFADAQRAIRRLTFETAQPAPPAADVWEGAATIRDARHGYLQLLDERGLAAWAGERGLRLSLLVRPGEYVFPGAPIARLLGDADSGDVARAIADATALGGERAAGADLEFSMRQLVEVAVRALSPGINDPHTAIGVLDRLGAALCELAPRHLSQGATLFEDRVTLVVPAIDYDGLADAMFNMIRQSARGGAAVLIHLVEVLNAVLSVERDEARRATLRRHVGLVAADAEASIGNKADLADLMERVRRALPAQAGAGGPRPA